MIDTDWLRRKAAAAVRIGDARPAEVTLNVDNRDGAFTAPAGPIPTGIIRIERDLTEDEAEQVQQRFETALRPEPRSKPLRCTCVAIYSECRCTGTNISARTNAADFHIDHQ